MKAFRGIFIIYKKELKVAFGSLMAYVIFACLIASFNYFFLDSTLMSGYLDTRSAFEEVLFLVFIFSPLITMRLVAEERKNKTMELLLSSPLSSLEIVLGKYLFALSFFLLVMFISLGIILILSLNSSIVYGVLFSQYLGLFLFSSALLSIGLMFSSLSENQVTAVVLSFSFSLFLYLAGGFGTMIQNDALRSFLNELTLVNHIASFNDGVLEFKDAVYYLLVTSFFLFLSQKMIDFKR